MVDAAAMVKALKLTELVPSQTGFLPIEASDINRPGIQLAGFWDHFADERPQIIGLVETSYLGSLDAATRRERLEKFVSYELPCIIICRGLGGLDDLIELARARKIPVYRTGESTTRLMIDIIYFLNNHLAPRTTMHGVLVEVYGVGVLLTGESGVGKSEAALELVKRGHQLVADDVVDICRVSDTRLVGECPEMVRHFMEIRGIGIIDIRAMYGVGAVAVSKSIDLVMHMEKWQADKEYDRLGLQDEYITILGVKVPHQLTPVRPGRNMAIIIEVAARNLSLKRLGYSAAHELDRRMNEMILRKTGQL